MNHAFSSACARALKVSAAIAVVTILSACAASHPPAASPMANFYHNTLVTDHGAAGLFYVFFNDDGTYEVTHNAKIERQGRYTYENGQLCMEVDGNPKGECPPFNADLKVGESWEAKSPNGHSENC